MKVSWLGLSLLSSLAVPTSAAPSDLESKEGNNLVKRWGTHAVDPDVPSVFNGLDVPALFQLTPENFEEATKDSTWSVLSSPRWNITC
jgi:protein disulfide-isomerase